MIYLKVLLVIYSILLIYLIHKNNRYREILESNFSREIALTVLFDRTKDVIDYLEVELSKHQTESEMLIHKVISNKMFEGNVGDGE